MSQVRIVDASYVDVPETAVRLPRPIKLTAVEALWIIIPVLQHVLLYEGDDDMPPFDAIAQSLRSSLAGNIQRLKQRIVHLGESHGAPLPHPPSTFTAVVALACTCFARCKPFSSEEDAQPFFFADTRDRLDPPVDAGYIGACLTGSLLKLPVPELRGDRALAAAALRVQDEINKVKEDPVAGWNFFTVITDVCMERMMNISGSSGFRAYEIADFGWGKPRRTEPITMNHDGQVVLMHRRDGQGVQVSVSLLQPAHMDAFKSSFLELLK